MVCRPLSPFPGGWSARTSPSLNPLPGFSGRHRPARAVAMVCRARFFWVVLLGTLIVGLLLADEVVAGSGLADDMRSDRQAVQRLQQALGSLPRFLGGDGMYTVPLPEDRLLFVFGDTFVAPTDDGRDRRTSAFVNNTVALGEIDPLTGEIASLAFCADPDLLPFFPSPGSGTYQWPLDGCVSGNRLFLFSVVIKAVAHDPFGFRTAGNRLTIVENPADPMSRWNRREVVVPWSAVRGDEHVVWGAAVLADVSSDPAEGDGWVWIYGTTQTSRGRRYLVAARAPAGRLDEFAAWQFRTGSQGWSSSRSDMGLLARDVPTEFSLVRDPRGPGYLWVGSTGGGFGGEVEVRWSSSPDLHGALTISKIPCLRHDLARGHFAYSAKAIRLSLFDRSEEVLLPVVYFANAFVPEDLFADPTLYWPICEAIVLPR
jgi:hypothetical protein